VQTTFAPPAVQADLQAIVDGIKARHAAERARQRAHYIPMAAEAVADKRARLQAELIAAQAGFDPAYAFSDDHTLWREQLAKAEAIGRCTRELAALGEVA
jgi:hypothetical protein